MKPYLFTLFIALSLCSCNNLKYVKSESTEKYTPIYKPNGGQKNQTVFNKRKVELESLKMLILQQTYDNQIGVVYNSSENTNKVIEAKVKAIEEYNRKLAEIENKIKSLSLTDENYEDKLLSYKVELNNFLCKEKEGIIQLDDKVEILYGDISFKTGSYEITGTGDKTIKDICLQVESEVARWKNYVNHCNQHIFENESYVLIMQISGYADQRGDETSNLTLSQKRANEVQATMIKELKSLAASKNLVLIFDKISSVGYGEKLPPGITMGPKDDPKRRICLINFMVGPARYID